jgi:hypothetical protein
MRLLDRIRQRMLWTLVGVCATAVGVIVWTTLPAWPVVGVAVATVVLAVNTLASRVRHNTCLGCGGSIAGLVSSEHGVICPHCGVATPTPGSLRNTGPGANDRRA